MQLVDPDKSADATGESSRSALQPLRTRLLDLIEKATNPEVQVEASRLMTCIVDLDKVDDGDVALIESALAALSAQSNNIDVSKFARNRLELKIRYKKGGLVPWISRKLGDSPVYAMMMGVLASALIWSVTFSAVVGISQMWVDAVHGEYLMPPRQAVPLAFAAFVGGLVSLLSRVDAFAKLYIFDPFLVFINSLLKPLIGTILALTMYAIIQSKIIQVSGISFDLPEGSYRYVFWAFGFIAGFSERLAGDFIARTETVVGHPQAGGTGIKAGKK